VRQLAQRTGKAEAEILHEAVEKLMLEASAESRLTALRRARGMWETALTCPISTRYVPMAGTTPPRPPMAKLLLDTSILVDYLRNKPAAVAYVEATAAQQLLAAIVVAELCGGVRDGAERAQLDALVHNATLVTLNSKHFPMLPGLLVPYQKI